MYIFIVRNLFESRVKLMTKVGRVQFCALSLSYMGLCDREDALQENNLLPTVLLDRVRETECSTISKLIEISFSFPT